MDVIKNIDKELLLFINGNHHPTLDTFFWIVSSDYFLYPFVLLLILNFKNKAPKIHFLFIFLMLLGILISDQTANLFKNYLVCRLRPSHEPSLGYLLHFVKDYKGGPYGFYSAHASNSVFVLLLLMSFYEIKNFSIRLLSVILILLIGYSRIYLGVHYPTDILAGWFAGGLIFLVINRLKKYIIKHA